MTILMWGRSGKCWVTRFVSRRLWAEIATWPTATSGLQGFGLQRTKCWPIGWRLLTPWRGFAMCLDWRGEVQ